MTIAKQLEIDWTASPTKDALTHYFLRTGQYEYLQNLERRKKHCGEAVKAAQKVYDRLREYLDADLSRRLILDYFTLKLIEHNEFYLRLRPLVDWQLTGKEGIRDLDVSEIDNLDWQQIYPLTLGWIYSKVMDEAVKARNSAIYTPEEIVCFMVQSNINWGHIARETSELKMYDRDFTLDEVDNPNVLLKFHERLGDFKILDPCCGCGNFPYVVLHYLAKMDDEIIALLQSHGVEARRVTGLHQLHGIDIDPISCEICKRVLQMAWWECDYPSHFGVTLDPWLLSHGFDFAQNSYCMSQIRNEDALRELKP